MDFATSSVNGGAVLLSLVIFVAIYILIALPAWGTYQKASPQGDPAWAAFVPVYNFIVLLRIAGRPKNWAWFLLLLIGQIIPVIGFFTSIAFFVIYVMVANDLSKSFGHGPGFTVGLVFVIFPIVPIIFWFILWLGKSQYLGPKGPAGIQAGYGAGGFPEPGYPRRLATPSRAAIRLRRPAIPSRAATPRPRPGPAIRRRPSPARPTRRLRPRRGRVRRHHHRRVGPSPRLRPRRRTTVGSPPRGGNYRDDGMSPGGTESSISRMASASARAEAGSSSRATRADAPRSGLRRSTLSVWSAGAWTGWSK